MSSAIELQYAEVYGLTHKKADTRQRFLSKVVEKVAKTSDDDWEQLTADAQRWFNAAVKAWDADTTIPDFPDADDDGRPEAEASDGDQGAEDGPAERGEEDNMARSAKKRAAPKKGAANKKAAAPAAKKRTYVATNGQLAESGSSILKRAMLKDMTLKEDQLAKILKTKDFPLSPFKIDSLRADFRHTIRLLQEEGKLKEKYDF